MIWRTHFVRRTLTFIRERTDIRYDSFKTRHKPCCHWIASGWQHLVVAKLLFHTIMRQSYIPLHVDFQTLAITSMQQRASVKIQLAVEKKLERCWQNRPLPLSAFALRVIAKNQRVYGDYEHTLWSYSYVKLFNSGESKQAMKKTTALLREKMSLEKELNKLSKDFEVHLL